MEEKFIKRPERSIYNYPKVLTSKKIHILCWEAQHSKMLNTFANEKIEKEKFTPVCQ